MLGGMHNGGIRFIPPEAAKVFEQQVARHCRYYHELFHKLRGVWVKDDETFQMLLNVAEVQSYLGNVRNIIQNCAGKGRSVLPPAYRFDEAGPEDWCGDGI